MSTLEALSEEHLIDRMTRGDESALARLYDVVAPRAWGLARRLLRSDAEAEEVVQDVFLEVWRSATRYDPRRSTPTRWILVMTRARAIERLRQHGARGRLRERLESIQPFGDEALDAQLAMARDAHQLRQAMAQLPAEQRRVLEHAYHDGLTQAEIAELTATPLGTVKTRTRIAMLRLADLIER